MAINQKNKKKELKEPDKFLQFVNDSIIYWHENKTQILGSIGIILLLFIFVISLRAYSNMKENNSSSLLGKAMNKYASIKDTDPKKAYTDCETDFKVIIDKYSGTSSSKYAKLYWANMCYENADYDKALSLYEESMKNFKADSFTHQLIIKNLGYSYMAKKDYEKSLKYFEILSNDKNSLINSDVWYNMGIIYSRLGQNDKSANAFKKILSDYPDSIYINIVKEKTAI
ncbi:MAG: tetratricopeptide repeat protein [Desulfobacterales bacterium]|nr:tetratricopeptide repeat protein [Desulfobacterales bacterium]